MGFAEDIWKEALELKKFAASQFKIPYDEADEWVSETGIECIEKKDQYDHKKVKTLRAWVKTIMLNKYVDKYRREKNYFYILNKEKTQMVVQLRLRKTLL